MATLNAVLSALVLQVQQATCNLTDGDGNPFQVKVAKGYPPEQVLADTARGRYAAIGIIDRKIGRSITSWGPRRIGGSVTQAVLTSSFGPAGSPAVSRVKLPPGGSATLALGAQVAAGDAVSLYADIPLSTAETTAQIAVAGGSDTSAAVAARLAAQVNADPAFSALVVASAAASAVTVQSRAAAPLVLHSYTGNGGTTLHELSRTQRQMQLFVWTGGDDQRNVVGAVVEQLFAQMEVYDGPFYMGLPLASGEAAQLINGHNFDIDDAVLSNSYRRDFLFGVEYSVTTTDTLWAVLVSSQSIQPST